MLKTGLKDSRTLKRMRRWVRARIGGYPDWGFLLLKEQDRFRSALLASKTGPKILIATSVGGHLPGAMLESLLAAALTVRGAEVHILLCDSFLPACLESLVSWYPDQRRFVRYGPSKDLCKDCFSPADAMYQSLGVPVHRYSEFVTADELQEAERVSSSLPISNLERYRLDDIAVGEHAKAGALRFFARGNLDGEPYAEPIVRRYLKAALLTTFAASRLMKTFRFDCAAFHHGIYVPQGLIGEVARREKVRVVNWNPAYRKKCFIFSHQDTYHHTLMNEPVASWEKMAWTPEKEAELMEYLKSRWQGTKDWIWFHEKPEEDPMAIAKELGVDFSRPCIGMLTNVFWDAQLHYPANAFPDMRDWAVRTIAYFSKRPELQLLVRVHPAEIRGTVPSRQPMVDEIQKAFPILPKNVFLIPPESRVSTYAAMAKCNAVIIYGTKTGVELTSMGIPTLVAGEAWIRNKGITLDATSAGDYFKLLDRLPFRQPLDKATVERARKYAYHFFFRRMIPIKNIVPAKGWPPYKVQLSGMDDLKPGRDAGLDRVCEGILNGVDFIYEPDPVRVGSGEHDRRHL